MSLALIKAALVTHAKAVSGITRVYDDEPSVAPTNADCPAAVILRQDPFLVVSTPVNDQVRYDWQFDIWFLYKPVGVDTPDAWDAGLEPFPALLIAELMGHLTLDSNCTDLDVEPHINVGLIQYGAGTYFGFHFNLVVHEDVTTTFAA